MAIATLADIRLSRTDTPPPESTTAALNAIAAWVPSETLAAYVAVLPLLPAVVANENTKLCATGDFSDRWLLFGVMLALTLFLIPVYTAVKARRDPGVRFRGPLLEMMIGGTALAIWAFALPSSPADDFCWVETWHKALAVVVGAVVLGAAGLLLNLRKPEQPMAEEQDPPSDQPIAFADSGPRPPRVR
jgi:cytochrome c-type biogenesis protein CcmH/NrfG